MIRIVLPAHLKALARVSGEVTVDPAGPATQAAVISALEASYPILRGVIRDPGTLRPRASLRFFAGARDLSNETPDAPLPEAVAKGELPFLIVGAIAGKS